MILSSSSLSSSLSLLLPFSSALWPSPVIVKTNVFYSIFLLLPLLYTSTVTENSTNSSTAAQLPLIIGKTLDAASQIPGTVAQNLDFVFQQQQKQQCPPNTFRCGDGSCIPQDWVDDGEADCNDSSDEKIRSTTSMNDPSAIDATMTSNSGMSMSDAEEAFEDPFDQIATVAPSDGDKLFLSVSSFSSTTVSTKSSSRGALQKRINDLQGCSNGVQTRVDQCSSDLTDWLYNLEQVDQTNLSMLNDEKRWRELDHGCELLFEFRMCTETLNISACVLPKSIQLWNSIELYVCQLLLPSMKEYKSCFEKAQNSNCSTDNEIRNNNNTPIMCRILTSVESGLRCIQQQNQLGCSTNALEVIEPLKSETKHMYIQLACPYVIASSSTTANVISSVDAIINSSILPESKSKDEGLECCNDVVHTFIIIDKVCATPINDQWKFVQRAVCANKDKIIQHKKCFLNASNVAAQCNHKAELETICDALEGFSKNIDCALLVMNDVCTVEAQNVVVTVQDTLNDDLIANRCYKDTIKDSSSSFSESFRLNPQNVRCTSEQENLALACLVELVEVNKKMAELQNLNFLHEISQRNSGLVSAICDLYQKYDSCINSTVFALSNKQRCAFNSPLNTLARIGLSPICSHVTRTLLQKNSDCIWKVENRASLCQAGLNSLGPAIHSMLQGINGEAHLCNSYYLIRDAFACGEKLVAEACTTEAVLDLRQIQQMMIDLGIEEGCPKERPSNLQEIISHPAIAPIARPLPKLDSSRKEVQNGRITACDPSDERFVTCIQPITAFQPHPLAVIKQPKQIDEACNHYIEFKKCQENISCTPLWVKGMSAMFEYACGPGYNTYIQVRQCVRKTTTREDIRKCVGEFSHAAPQFACQSSNKLISCALPIITEKCGHLGAHFVTNYIDKFATVIDPTCKIGTQQNDKAITAHNCTTEQIALVDQCASPINELTARIDELFEGGLQQFLSNVKNLAPVFAQGCNLTSKFRSCLQPLFERNSEQCVVTSCLIRAADSICDQPDTAQAIDDNLACVFQQASQPEFGKCLRATITNLKQFNLAALRSVLPQFVRCVEHIVVQHCGQIPINILRAISTAEVCPIGSDFESVTNLQAPTTCTVEMEQKHMDCVGNFYRNYRMLPIVLLRDPSKADALCKEVSKLNSCSYPTCEENKYKALKALAEFVCIRLDAYKKHVPCLVSVATSSEGSQCMSAFMTTSPQRQCMSLRNVANCAASSVYNICGMEALKLSFEGMHTFMQQLNHSCSIQIPLATLKTSCSESDVVEYLQCENTIDRFSFTPISFIRNSSQWEGFCEAVLDYGNCLGNMSCRIEPVSSANLELFRTVCKDEESKTRSFLPCLTEFLSTDTGKSCNELFHSLDLLAKDVSSTICRSAKTILSCVASNLSAQCTEQAFNHVSKMFDIWVKKFDPDCSTVGFSMSKNGKPEEELSLDSSPIQIANDQTISPNSATSIKISQISFNTVPSSESTFIPELNFNPNTHHNLSSVINNNSKVEMTDKIPTTDLKTKSVLESDKAPSSSKELNLVPNWEESQPSTVSEPEQFSTKSDLTDVESSSPVSLLGHKSDVVSKTVNKTNWRTQGSVSINNSHTNLWAILIAMSSIIVVKLWV